jgi:hypothetical protein
MKVMDDLKKRPAVLIQTTAGLSMPIQVVTDMKILRDPPSAERQEA